MRERQRQSKKGTKQGGEGRHDREESIMWSELEVGPELDGGWSAASEGSIDGALDGGGGVIPELAQARASCSRRSFPRAWNAAHGHRALSISVGTRNVFASSSACTRLLSPSHSARHVATWLVNQPISNGRRRKMCAAGLAGALSPAP